MSKRTICIVDRGPMEKVSAIVWEHEIRILEEIHGEGNVTRVDTAKLTDGKEALIIKGTNQLIPADSQTFKIKKDDKGREVVEIVALTKGEPTVITKEIQRVPLVPLLERSLGIGEPFSGDLDAEYARLETLYGMHHEERVTNVRAVYGRLHEGRFALAVSGGRQAVTKQEAEVES